MVDHDQQPHAIGETVAHDVIVRKKAETALHEAEQELERRVEEARLNESRLEAVLQLNHMTEASLKEITDFALEQAVALTKSKIGYLAFMNEDESTLTMHSWSKEAMADCAIDDKPIVYPVVTTGLWGEAVRQRKPIVTNDYPAANLWKKGLPEGHVELRRHMNVPIFEEGRIVIVAGVGNKKEDYDTSDVRQLTLLMEGMWTLIQRHRMQAELRQHRDHLQQLVRDRTEALRQSHDELQAIYDGMVDGLLIADVETKRFVRANPAICQILGYSEDELLSLSVMDIHPAEELPAALEKFQAQATGRIRINEDARVLRKDGTVVHTDITGEAITYHERPCLIKFFRDITERKRAEVALQESNERVRTICDSALDAVIMVDNNGKALYWNPAAERMFGYSCDEMLGRDVHAILTPARYCEHAIEAFENFRMSGRGRAVGTVLELTALRKDGTEFPIEIAVAGFKMSDQWCAAAIIRDISERKKAQEALERERGTLRHLLESSDHERHLISCEIHDGLAQQLAGAIMQFEAYKSSKDTAPERASEALALGTQLVREGNVEARRLIGGLRLPQLDEGGILVAIQNLVEECSKRNKVKIEFCSNVAQLNLTPMLENTVFRIVQECLTNACRYSKSKKVKVELTQHDDQLRIEVQDWGVGFKVGEVGEGHFGLEGIQERAKVFGGHAIIKSSLREGTNIIVELPLHPISP